jgi:hypothetical protein
LDEWRATRPDGRAFTNCSVCDFQYVIVQEHAPGSEEYQRQASSPQVPSRHCLSVALAVVFVCAGCILHM